MSKNDEFESFKRAQQKGYLHVREYSSIDILMELFGMLRADALYGLPGTDGSFSVMSFESIKNDNDVISMFYA